MIHKILAMEKPTEGQDAARHSPSAGGLQRLIIANLLEWSEQPDRRDLPGNPPPPLGAPLPAEDMALFWSGDNKLVVTRHPQCSRHVDDCRAILGYDQLLTSSPGSADFTASLSTDLADDERALAGLVDLLNNHPADGPIYVEAYGPTPEYSRLIASIRSRTSRTVQDCMTPADKLRWVSLLDSKTKIRDFFAAAVPPDRSVRLTRAFTIRPGTDLAEFVRCTLPVLGPVIVKSEFGSGGHAMQRIDNLDNLDKLLAEFLPAGYDADLLVEEYLDPADRVLPLIYNGVVGPAGEVTTRCAGIQLVHQELHFVGTSLGRGSLPPECAAQVLAMGEATGRIMSAIGFRGSFTLDFLYQRDDAILFPSEINPRRGLTSTLADICIQLLGTGFEDVASARAVRHVPVHPAIGTYTALRDFLLRIDLFGRIADGDIVVLPYMVSSLPISSSIGLVVVGPAPDSVDAVWAEVTDRLVRGPAPAPAPLTAMHR
jgi:hypothetical protein